MIVRRLVLLSLRARRDAYLGDGGLAALSARLTREGHEVTHAELVPELGVELDARHWPEELRRALREAPFAVVVARAWSEELVGSLRALAGPDVMLVRFSSTGDRGALDVRFDHVLDDAGLSALLGGAPGPAAPTFKPRRAAELRALRAEARLAPAWAAHEHGERAAPLAEGALPTLTGPSRGCPYLRDARGAAPFAKLEPLAGRELLQFKGCTFCLDNDGAYVASSEADTLAAWLGQLRAHRARDPDVRRVLLTDERPHAFLPAFFEALAREPSLFGVELLVKSRVDWLLEGEQELARAASLAVASRSVLHLYLVGFESFDPFHLELFNKGHDVAASRRAIDKLRELGARFPSSFEYKSLRAHGIVLFTPWTSPDALLENARVMREVDFHELRSEALRTRLRLHPRTPLHALAAADGLLAEAFPSARPDRATEQGYDASVPWRFRDARTEAIFVAATSLARHERAAREADVLELACRFVLRFPALAAHPEATPALLMRALGSWGGSLSRLGEAGPSFAYLDRELALLLGGHKQALLIEGVPSGDAHGLARAHEALGLAAAVLSTHELDPATGRHAPGSSRAIVAVARDRSALAEVTRAQAQVERGEPAAIVAMGELMGYPACCARAFSELAERGDNLANERAPFQRAPGAALAPLVSRVGAVRLLSHHLCSPDCDASQALASVALAEVERESPAAAAWVRARVGAAVLFVDYERRWEVAGHFEEGAFHLDRDPVPLGGAPPLEGVARVAVSRAGLELTRREGPSTRLAAASPWLAIPGRPLDPTIAEALGPPPEASRSRGAQGRAGAHLGEPRGALGPLPTTLRRGVRARAHVVRSVTVRDDEHQLELARGDETLLLRVRTAPRDGFVPVGRYFAKLESEPSSLDEAARAALVLVQAALSRG